MASGAVQKRVEVTNGLDLIWESRVLYADILFSFRECHDVCLHSQLFSSDIILKIDQCAVDFRQLSFDTVTIAKRVSNQWLDVAITFFENIDQADDPKEMLKLLGDQARELARCFKLIAAWARNLAGRFHAAQDGTIKEAEVFKQAFEAAHTEAESVRQQAQEELDKASKTRAKHASSESGWKYAQIWFSWCPIAHVVTGPGAHAAKKKHAKSAELEAEAREKLRKTQQQLEEKRSQHEKAKVVAEKAATLVKVLGKLEETCEAVAAFWTMEADKFDSQGAKMKNSQVAMLKGMKGMVVKDNISFWKKAKEEMDCYVTAMSVINNCFNFTTAAKPPAGRAIKFANLDLEFHVPTDINIKKITG